MRKWGAATKMDITFEVLVRLTSNLHLLEGVSYAGVDWHQHQCHGYITA